MGYRDGQTGTEADIEERVKYLEWCCESYAKALRNMHKEAK